MIQSLLAFVVWIGPDSEDARMEWSFFWIVVVGAMASVLLIFGAILVEIAKGLPPLLKRLRFSLAFLLLVQVAAGIVWSCFRGFRIEFSMDYICSLGLVFAVVTVLLTIIAVPGRHFMELCGIGGIDLQRYRRMRDQNPADERTVTSDGDAGKLKTRTKWYLRPYRPRECRPVHGQSHRF